ncbi:MAG: DNA-3-methyladenine glycosylase I [Bacteroidota bacterium]
MEKLNRCQWCLSDPIYIKYHDEEWGVPVRDDQKLFEMINLEGAQAGLSWITVLKKRAGYRELFANFEAEILVNYTDDQLEALRHDTRIIRNRLKINAVRSNARAYLEIQASLGSFSDYLWQFTDGKIIQNHLKGMDDYRATSQQSDAMSKDLKKRGFKFVGSTICYAFMEAAGMVNDHFVDCFRHAELLDV